MARHQIKRNDVKRKIRVLFVVFISLILLSLSGCQWNHNTQKEIGKEEIAQNVAKSFESTLKDYPTPNIESLLGKDMGNELILDTAIHKTKDNKKETPLVVEGMILYLNTSTKKGYGYYYIRKYYDSASKDKKTNYPVDYDHGIHLCKSTGDKELDEKIKNFKFLFQYANFKDLNKQKVIDADYNPEVPLFSADYQLSNDNSLVKKLRHDYHFTQKEAPIVHLQGTGNYGDSPSFGGFDDRQVEIYFSKKPTNSVYSSITYNDNWEEEEDN